MSLFTQEGSCFSRNMFVLLLAVLGPVSAFGSPKNKNQLYDGPPKPSDQVATFNFNSRNPGVVDILIDRKWVQLHQGAQVLPGTYQLKFSMVCTFGQSGGKYSIPFFTSVGDQGQVVVSAGDSVNVWFGKNDHAYGPCVGPSFNLAVVHPAAAENATPTPPPSLPAPAGPSTNPSLTPPPVVATIASSAPAPVARLADGTIVQPGYVFPVTNKKDLKFLQHAEGAKLGNTTLPSGQFVPAAPGGMSWRVRGGKIVLEENP